VAPSLLPEDCPAELDTAWPSACTAGVIPFGRFYDLSFLPIGLFCRLIVRVRSPLPPPSYSKRVAH
jgi:hypothetical protein